MHLINGEKAIFFSLIVIFVIVCTVMYFSFFLFFFFLLLNCLFIIFVFLGKQSLALFDLTFLSLFFEIQSG